MNDWDADSIGFLDIFTHITTSLLSHLKDFAKPASPKVVGSSLGHVIIFITTDFGDFL